MKKIACLFFCLILCSCVHSEPDCGGSARVAMKSSSEESDNSDDWGCAGPPPPLDNIKPSSDKLWFNAEGGIDSITTEGETWDISYYTTDSIIVLSIVNGEVINIKTSWLTLDKPNKNKIIFSANKNETGKEREFFVGLYDKNSYYHTYIDVKQSAEN